MDAVTQVPAPVNEPVHTYAPGSPERARLEAQAQGAGREPDRAADDDRRRQADGRRRALRRRTAAQPQGRHRHVTPTPPSRTRRTRSTPRWPPPRPGARCPSTTAPRSSCTPPSCCPARGARRSPPPPCSASPRPPAGRDRHPLRADRLLALQRPLRARDPARRAAGRPTRRACGTGWTTARSRASSTRSRRSTSRPSPATCPPPPP